LSSGSPPAIGEFGQMLLNQSTEGLSATSYIKMMPHTTAVNLCVFFGLRGRVITTSSACTSGSQGIGYAYESIRMGKQIVMVAGGADELSPTQTAVFDTLYATSTRNDEPHLTPRPFDADRDGLVVGEGAATFVLEEYEHARARRGHTRRDHWIWHQRRRRARHAAGTGDDADLHGARPGRRQSSANDISKVRHGTATDRGDVAESQATGALFGPKIPISSLKSYTGHTLGACGAIEAFVLVNMMRERRFHPTINLDRVDPECAPLDYIVGESRSLLRAHDQQQFRLRRCKHVVGVSATGVNSRLNK
jgi:3-oxoacyl-[acyl-carrier-protein] synthase II